MSDFTKNMKKCAKKLKKRFPKRCSLSFFVKKSKKKGKKMLFFLAHLELRLGASTKNKRKKQQKRRFFVYFLLMLLGCCFPSLEFVDAHRWFMDEKTTRPRGRGFWTSAKVHYCPGMSELLSDIKIFNRWIGQVKLFKIASFHFHCK